MSATIIVTGANGQLGRELQDLSIHHPDYHFEFYGSNLLDISSQVSIEKALAERHVDYIINCAAYTQVDRAEEEIDKANLINAEALRYLSAACNKSGATLIHLSSDYVYNSINDRPLMESDPKRPKSVYAQTKLKGEELLSRFCGKWIIIRTSWVYSTYGNNFVKTMLRVGRERDELNIVDDQIGTPTYAADIAKVILKFVNELERNENGDDHLNEIYNFSNEGQTSWDAFAKKIFDLSEIDCKVNGITTAAYGAKAPRPLWSVLSKKKIETTLGLNIRHWESALTECLSKMESAN